MCDMQKLPTREDASCEDETDMNFAAFSAVGSAGTHFVTTGGQLTVPKIQQNVANNGNLQQVCLAMGDNGVQYVRTLDGGATLQTAPQLISVPISLPGSKPGDPQPTVQIQVLNPNQLIQAQQPPKYQMQLQGFQQGGAVLTVAYSPETNDAGNIRLVGQGGIGEGLQVLTALPQEMQLVQQTHTQDKEQIPTNMHQVFITPNQQIIINTPDGKILNNNTTSDNNNTGDEDIIIKEECDENVNDDESSQGTESGDTIQWRIGTNNQDDLVKYLNSLPQQQTQELPASLQQFLRMNPTDLKKEVTVISTEEDRSNDDKKQEEMNSTDAPLWEDDSKAQSKKKKKYKKKPPKPARPKPGQIVIATAMDGTPIYCCPECHMAYPEKEQLEVHLLGHNIERRFICGLCGAGLKRKEHLERHKLGHNPERPYVCGVCRKGFKRREHLNLHTVIHSGVKTEMCNVCGKGFYRKDHLRKHTRSHESKRARDEANNDGTSTNQVHNISSVVLPATPTSQTTQNIMPEITIHIPTSNSNQAPVQINIPSHVVTSLAAHGDHNTLDALLAHHT